MTRRIFVKVFLTIVVLLAIAGLGAEFLVSRITEENHRADLDQALLEKSRLTQALLEISDPASYPEVAAEISRRALARVTIIDRQGNPLADSDANPERMENHGQRPEFIAALAGRTGYATRHSETVGQDLRYCAVPMKGGAVRLALPLSAIDARVQEIRSQILQMLALALVPAMFIAAWLARKVSSQLSQVISYSKRLAQGNFQAKLPNMGGGEIGELADTLRTTGGQLRSMFEQLQEERSRFAAAVNGIGEGILVADRKLRTVLFNPAMEQMLPNTRLYKGASLEEWERPEVPELFRKVLEDGEACSVDIQVHDPVERSWKISCAPILSRKGKVHAVVAVFYDITELERLDRMRKDFVINVSHELRTPLAAIQGYAETLLDGAIDEPGTNRRFMRILWQNAERLAQLTADLMTLSQIEVSTREFSFTPHLLRELLEQAADSNRAIAEKKSVTVEVAPVPEGLRVECDSGAIHQVLNNLLDNAIKYTPEGGSVTVGATVSQEGDRVELFVRDTGLGIPPEHIPRLFERFYRVDKARSRELGGTGLGLAIVKHLVMAHLGSVRVESAPGKGSTFFFEIPVRRPVDAPQVDGRQRVLF
ncbi:MAG: PAS domain-containing protein [Acidobacteria bacterium]|nr:PAS domain-containing protein [Acidobacteriota bacterium]